ncbi:MAG: hypothetical protein ACP5KE_03915 [Candidatus Methanodesulfokora sp.]
MPMSNIETFPDLIRLHGLLSVIEDDLADGRAPDRRILKRTIKRIRKIRKDENMSLLLTSSMPLSFLLEDVRNDVALKEMRRAIERTIIMSKFRGIRSKIGLNKPMHYIMTYPVEEAVKAFEFIEGMRPVVLTVPHSSPPFQDKGITGIAREIAKSSGAHLLLSKISRVFVDYNRCSSRIYPARVFLERIIMERRIKGVIDLHSSNMLEHDVEIGCFSGQTVPKSVLKILEECLRRNNVKYTKEGRFGGDIVWFHSILPDVWGIQIEISTNARKNRIVKALTNFVERL